MTDDDRQTYAEPANSIIEALGGGLAVARALRLAPSTVYRWRLPASEQSYGADGFVPREHHDALIRIAAERGLTLHRKDFLAEGAISIARLRSRARQQDRIAG